MSPADQYDQGTPSQPVSVLSIHFSPQLVHRYFVQLNKINNAKKQIGEFASEQGRNYLGMLE